MKPPLGSDTPFIPVEVRTACHALEYDDLVALRLLGKETCEICGLGFEEGQLVFSVGGEHAACIWLAPHKTDSNTGGWNHGQIREGGRYFLRFFQR